MFTDEAVDGRRQRAPRRPCVMLVHGPAAPASLLSGLHRRGIAVTLAHTPPEVMATLASLDGAGAVIVVNPGQPRVAELIDAVGQYYPRVGVWCWQAADRQNSEGRRRLVRQSAAKQTASFGHGSPDPGDFFGNGGISSPSANNGGQTRPLVSQAELAMLLGRGGERERVAQAPATASSSATQPDRKKG